MEIVYEILPYKVRGLMYMGGGGGNVLFTPDFWLASGRKRCLAVRARDGATGFQRQTILMLIFFIIYRISTR